jgi:hypothetical protein
MKPKRPVEGWVDAVLSPNGLSPSEKLVAVVMARFMNWTTLANAYPGPSRVAAMTGLHVSTVKRCLDVLCVREWLVQTSKGWVDACR